MRKAFLAIAFLALVCKTGAAVPTSYVQNTNDSGTGSLRQGILDSNTAGGSNTLAWMPGTGGTITLASDLATIITGTTLDVTASTNPVTITGNYSIPLAGVVTLTNDNISDIWTISSYISGSGELVKSGGGTLVLTQANSYGGGTEIDGGTLNINSDAELGSSSGGLTFNGGTLQNAADISSARTVLLDSNGGTFDTNGYNLLLSGLISGNGALTKKGTGTLVLTHQNTYTGNTVISSGTLQLGVNEALSSNGTVLVSQDAVFDMSSYIQHLTGYNGSGTLRLLLASGVTNLVVTGSAVLGGTLVVNFTPQIFTSGQTFTPITASALTGTFSSIVSPAAITFVPTYDATGLLLTAELVPFTNLAATDNQRIIGNVLEPLRDNPSGDMATVLGNLYTLDTAGIQAALDQTGPAALFSMQGISLSGSSLQTAALARRMDMIYLGNSGGIAVDLHGKDMSDKTAQTSAKTGSDTGFFASVIGATGRSKTSDDNAGYTFYNGGVIMGGDYHVSDNLAAGLYGGYLHGQASITYPGSGTVNNDSLRYGVYAATHGGSFHFNLYAGMANDFFSTERDIAFASIARAASAKPRASEVNCYAATRYDFKKGDSDTISPLAELNYDRMRIDSFAESGADALDLAVNSQTAQSLRSNIGLRYDDKSIVDGYKMASYISAGWRHEFKDTNTMEASFASAGSAPFVITAGDLGNNGLLAGVGTAFNWGTDVTVNVDYSGDFRARLTQHALNVGTHIKF